MKKALVIGINSYPTSPLNGSINDAAGVANVLETHGDGAPNFGVILKTNVHNKSDLKGLIVDLFSGDPDTALLYFSGHGFADETGGFIVTPDHKKYDEGISMDEILQLANNSKAKDKIIILDCCRSGYLGSPKALKGTSHLEVGVSILTSSKDDENSMEVNGHGVFTNLLIDALQGGAADLRGHITPGGIYAYIDQALGPWEQRPVFKTNVTRFTSLREITPRVSKEILRKLTAYFPTPQDNYQLNPSFEDTNALDIEHKVIEPHADPDKVAIFKNLQKLQSIGLVVPVDEQHMYYAAMNSKSCRLTALGYHYWNLVNGKLI
jgi:hypothetical protein